MPSEGAVTRRASVVLMPCPSRLASTAAIAIAPLDRDILSVLALRELITVVGRVEGGGCWWKSGRSRKKEVEAAQRPVLDGAR